MAIRQAVLEDPAIRSRGRHPRRVPSQRIAVIRHVECRAEANGARADHQIMAWAREATTSSSSSVQDAPTFFVQDVPVQTVEVAAPIVTPNQSQNAAPTVPVVAQIVAPNQSQTPN